MCVFLLVLIFFAVFQLFPCLAVLLCCFLLCCFGRFLTSFARFVYLVLLPFNLKVMRYHCAFLLRCYCRFCCLLGPAGGVAFSPVSPPLSCVYSNAPPVPFRAPPSPLIVSLRSKTLTCYLPNHVRTLAPPLGAHTWLCLCSRLFVFLCGCCAYCVCSHACVCAC